MLYLVASNGRAELTGRMSATPASLPEGWAAMSPADKAPWYAAAHRMLGDVKRTHPGLFSFVYAIQAGGDNGPVKIGVSDRPWERIKTLQQACWLPLVGLAAWHTLKTDEKAIHKQFAYAHIRGEWFHPVPALVRYVKLEGGSFCDWTDPAKYDPDQDDA